MLSREFHITGKVQGVYFRAAAKQKAEELGVAGWVGNNADGSVTVHAEGPDRLLTQFEQWCSVGPGGAQVERLTVKDAPQENASTFAIVY